MKRIYSLLFVISFLSAGLASSAQNFVPGNLVIYRVGTIGSGVTLTSAATEVFLDEYTPAGVYVRSIPLPTAVNGSNRRLTAGGSATSEGYLNRTVDKAYLMVPGYDAAVGTAAVAGTTGATVNRVAGRVDYTGAINTTTALTDFASSSSPRSTISTNGTDIFVSGGAGGVRYTTLGSTGTSTQLATTPTNTRVLEIYGGQLYTSSQSGAFRIATVGTGVPTTSGQTITNLPGAPTATGNPYGFFMADLDAGTPGIDVLYLADETAGSGITKYSLVAGTWTNNGTVVAPIRGMTGVVNAGVVTLYATTNLSSANSLISISDPAGYNVAFAGGTTTLTTAAPFTVFRGVDFAPELGVVPISLNNFTAQKVLNSVKLSWSTDQEINSSRFVIDRSSNGRNWVSINTVNAAGNSNRKIDYFVSDYSPLSGLNYYRLKSVDAAGNSQYSVVRLVSMSKDATMIISPNPAKDFINVNYLRNNNGPIIVTLADANGKTIMQTKTSESIIRLDLRNVGKGTYLVYVIDGDKVSSEKVLIQ